MSKRQLEKYLNSLSQKQLQEQILDLYDRFKPVKVFYDFVFNPQEEKLLNEFKTRVGKEYFPQGSRKPKMRRSIAQKQIAHFISIGFNPELLLDAMLFNIETAQAFTAERPINQNAFYKSMLKSFQQALAHARYHGFFDKYEHRFQRIIEITENQHWPNADDFYFDG